MRKVVINACYGGYSLSPAAIKRYAELKGIRLYPFILGFTDKNNERHATPLTWAEAVCKKKRLIDVRFYSIKPIVGNRVEMEDFWREDIQRDDPLLVQVVEELGKAANGHCASLKVVGIPDDVEWQIEEYDGSEHVAEKHRTWS